MLYFAIQQFYIAISVNCIRMRLRFLFVRLIPLMRSGRCRRLISPANAALFLLFVLAGVEQCHVCWSHSLNRVYDVGVLAMLAKGPWMVCRSVDGCRREFSIELYSNQ